MTSEKMQFILEEQIKLDRLTGFLEANGLGGSEILREEWSAEGYLTFVQGSDGRIIFIEGPHGREPKVDFVPWPNGFDYETFKELVYAAFPYLR